METRKTINGISNPTKQQIDAKSVKRLPAHPSASGYTQADIRNAQYNPILDEESPSLFTEINRIANDTEEALSTIDENIREVEGNIDGLSNVTYKAWEVDEMVERIDGDISTVASQAEDLEQNKLDKESATESVYANDESGMPTTKKYTSNSTPNTIASRDESGNIKVGNALANGDATNKQYVDQKVGEVIETIEGKKETYVISKDYYQNEFYYATSGKIGDDEFDLLSDSILYDISSGSPVFIDFSKLKVGDNIYVKETKVPDYWISSKSGGTVTFSRLETTKVDIEALSARITELAGKVDSDTESAQAYANQALEYKNQARDYTTQARKLVQNTMTRAEYEAITPIEDEYYIVVEE